MNAYERMGIDASILDVETTFCPTCGAYWKCEHKSLAAKTLDYRQAYSIGIDPAMPKGDYSAMVVRDGLGNVVAPELPSVSEVRASSGGGISYAEMVKRLREQNK